MPHAGISSYCGATVTETVLSEHNLYSLPFFGYLLYMVTTCCTWMFLCMGIKHKTHGPSIAPITIYYYYYLFDLHSAFLPEGNPRLSQRDHWIILYLENMNTICTFPPLLFAANEFLCENQSGHFMCNYVNFQVMMSLPD